jgi:hypothetical protein
MKTEVIDPVEYVFEKLASAYGAEWDRSLGQAPIADVKTAWADALSGFLHSDDAKRSIVWALKNLPERVMNSMEFRNLCRMAPARAKTLALPEPKADPARVAADLAKLGHVRKPVASAHGMKDWAHRLKARHEAGGKLNPNQIRCYCDALGMAA